MLGMDIHLPCSFGDKVYYISGVDKIKEATIRGFRIYQYCILYDVYNKEEDDYFVMESDEVYFSIKEAEENILEEKNPFGNLKPAEIPTRLHTFSYQGGKKDRGPK